MKCFYFQKQDKNDQTTYIYQQGKPVDYFVLILEGRVEVIVGKENLVFESGPFTYFGLQALVPQTSIIGKSPSSRRPTAATVSPVTAESPVVASQMGSLQSLNMDAMQRFSFQPDYSVRVVTDVLYMRVPRSLYLAAKRATLMERSTTDNNMEIDDDDKLLYSLDVDEESSQGRMSPKQTVEIHATNTPRMNSPHTIEQTNHPLNSDSLSTTINIDPNGVATFPQEERNGQEANDELTALIKRQQHQNVQALQKKDTEHKPS